MPSVRDPLTGRYANVDAVAWFCTCPDPILDSGECQSCHRKPWALMAGALRGPSL